MIGLGKKKKKPLDLSAPAAPAVAPSKKAKLQLPPSSSSSAPVSSAPLALPAAPEVAPTKVPDSREAASKKAVVGDKSSGEANKASRKRDVDAGDGDDAHQSSSDNSDDDEEGALSIDAIFESKKELKRLQKEQEESERKLAAKLAAEGKGKFKFDRSDLDKVEGTGKWVDDGLGGVYNKDGWTGRTDDGLKVYKAHLFNKKGFGTTKDCPFDCDCCFI